MQPQSSPKKDIYGPLYAQAEEARERSDYGTALELYRRCVEDGYHYGAIAIAHMYYVGNGVAKDKIEAERWLNKAVDTGGAAAMCNIGELYFRSGLGPQNPELAFRWLHKAADLGNFDAMCLLGLLYESLPGAKNEETGFYWQARASQTPEGAALLDAARKSIAESANVNSASEKSGTPNLKQGGKSGCFIATAACGSAFHPEVQMLRAYRDRVLLKRSWGRVAIRLYQRLSPPIADGIRERPWARRLVRAVLIRPLAHWADRRKQPATLHSLPNER